MHTQSNADINTVKLRYTAKMAERLALILSTNQKKVYDIKLCIHSQMRIYTQSNGDMQSNGGISGTECLLSSKECHKLNCTYTVKCRYIHCQMDINSQNDGKTGIDSLDKPKESVRHQTVHTQSNAYIYTVKWRYAIKQQNKCHWFSLET